jgi:hypothetical protein
MLHTTSTVVTPLLSSEHAVDVGGQARPSRAAVQGARHRCLSPARPRCAARDAPPAPPACPVAPLHSPRPPATLVPP